MARWSAMERLGTCSRRTCLPTSSGYAPESSWTMCRVGRCAFRSPPARNPSMGSPRWRPPARCETRRAPRSSSSSAALKGVGAAIDRGALTRGASASDCGHRTMRAAIEWSEALLSDAEGVLFRRLGVFVGSFDLPAAESVASGAGLAPEQVVPLLQRLVERSLVQFERGTGRYRLLETVRELALERVAQAGENESVRDAHAGHYCNLTWQRFPVMLTDTPTPVNPPDHLIDLGTPVRRPGARPTSRRARPRPAMPRRASPTPNARSTSLAVRGRWDGSASSLWLCSIWPRRGFGW